MKKIYRIYETNHEGKPIKCWGVFRAENQMDARKIASEHFKRKDIVSTGYFVAKKCTLKQLSDEFNSKLKNLLTERVIINL
jgi:hypothetical protein